MNMKGRSLNDPEKVTYFAETDARNKRTQFGIRSKDRSRHMYVIGKTGMGKSTLLENMAIQDIQNGEGIAFIDPHGKTADLLLEYVPEHRIKDVLYFAPFDMENPVAFNIMEDVGYDKRHLVVSGLMSTFKKIWEDAWSARMEYILSNTLLALLEYPGSTLLGVNRMLADKDFRKRVVDNVTDPSVKSFWVDEFAKYTERFAAEATPAIQNKIGQFTSNPLIRNIIGQSKSSFDMRKMMDEKKILIINLSKGRVGETNANLLGSMLITRIYLSAMSRADSSEAVLNKLPNFYLYVDEFQSFANESFADILSEARKYKLNLTMAHQYIEQMTEEVRAAVFGNVGTMVAFRVGAFDAEVLEKEFAPQFTGEDIVNLGQYQMYLKLMIDGVSSQPFSATGMPPIKKTTPDLRENILVESRKTFAKPRGEVETNIKEWHMPVGAGASRAGAPAGHSAPHSASTPHASLGVARPTPLPVRGDAPKPIPQNDMHPTTLNRPPRSTQFPPPVSLTQTQSAQANIPHRGEQSPVPHTHPTASFVQREVEPKKVMSLDQLKPVQPVLNNKKPSDKNLASLREALAHIKKTQENEAKKPAEGTVPLKDLKASAEAFLKKDETPMPMTHIAQHNEPKIEVVQKEPERKEVLKAEINKQPEVQKKGEVPEEVLKKILDMEPPKASV